MTLKIDPEFRDLIPPLSEDERRLLEQSIVAHGCIDPVVGWKGHDLILDGHNRHEICERVGVGYRVHWVELPDRESALDWIDAHQLGRRNLGPDQRALLIGRRYERSKRQGQKQQESTCRQSGEKSERTAKAIAETHQVSKRTVERAGAFARAVETVKAVDPQIEKKVVAGTAPSRERVMQAAKVIEMKPEAVDEVDAILSGKPAAKADPKPVETDPHGVPLTTAAMKLAFAVVPEFRSLMHQISGMDSAFKAFADTPAGAYSKAFEPEWKQAVKGLRDIVKASTPYGVCVYCGGDGCKGCRKSGFLTEIQWKQAPAEIRETFIRGAKK